MRSKGEADAGDHGSRLQEVRAAEGGEEVVQRHLVGQVRDVHRRGDAGVTFGVQQVVGAEPEIEDVARLDAGRVVVVVLLRRSGAG